MHMYIIEFAIRGSVTAVPSLWDCSLFSLMAGLASHARASPLATAHASVPASFHLPHPAVSLGIPDTPEWDTSLQFPESLKSRTPRT